MQGEKIDYVLPDTTSGNTVKEMKMDEEKQHGLHKREIQRPMKIKRYT